LLSRYRGEQVQHEIANVLCVLQGLVEFFAGRFKKTLFVRIAVCHGIGCQSVGGIAVLPERLEQPGRGTVQPPTYP
jgi:hypothetical protein